MALPKSTFVMGVVTLGLFGVAIYETAGKKAGHDRTHADDEDDRYDGDRDSDSEEARAEYARAEQDLAAKRAAEARARAETLAKKKAALPKLYGAETATPGALFAGVELDAKTTPEDWVGRRAAFMAQSGFRVQIGAGEANDRFEVVPASTLSGEVRDGLCLELENALATAWGNPYSDDNGVRLWTNKLAGIRASFKPSEECELVFERFDEPATWLNKSAKSTVPFGWVGRPAKQVADAVGETVNEDAIEWHAHGVGSGTEQTKIQAFLDKGKVARVIATTSVSAPTRAALVEHLRNEFGAPKTDSNQAGDVRFEWPAKKLLVVMSDNGTITVVSPKP